MENMSATQNRKSPTAEELFVSIPHVPIIWPLVSCECLTASRAIAVSPTPRETLRLLVFVLHLFIQYTVTDSTLTGQHGSRR